jgi:hypothetical protein
MASEGPLLPQLLRRLSQDARDNVITAHVKEIVKQKLFEFPEFGDEDERASIVRDAPVDYVSTAPSLAACFCLLDLCRREGLLLDEVHSEVQGLLFEGRSAETKAWDTAHARPAPTRTDHAAPSVPTAKSSEGENKGKHKRVRKPKEKHAAARQASATPGGRGPAAPAAEGASPVFFLTTQNTILRADVEGASIHGVSLHKMKERRSDCGPHSMTTLVSHTFAQTIF